MSTPKKSAFSFLVPFFDLGAATSVQAQAPIVPQSLYNKGDSIDISLGGATLAFPYSSSNFMKNPSAMPFQANNAELAFNIGHPQDSRRIQNLPIKSTDYSILGGAVQLSRIMAIGGGYLFERQNTLESSPTLFSSKATILDAHASAALATRWISVGAGYVDGSYRITNTSHTGESSTSFLNGKSFQYSAYIPIFSQFSLSAKWVLQREWKPFKSSDDQESQSFYSPERKEAGFHLWNRFGGTSGGFGLGVYRLLGQVTQLQYKSTAKEELHQYGESGANEQPVNTNSMHIYRLATELPLYYFRTTGFKLRFGFYREPPLVKSVAWRNHFCAGVSLRIWVIALSYSMDRALNFKNETYGVGLDFDR